MSLETCFSCISVSLWASRVCLTRPGELSGERTLFTMPPKRRSRTPYQGLTQKTSAPRASFPESLEGFLSFFHRSQPTS